MSITAAPNSTFSASAEGPTTGLVGSIGVQILDSDGAVVVARSTLGITETPAGSGLYYATLTAPGVNGSYTLLWDSGSVTPDTIATEDLLVADSVFSGGYCTPTQVYRADRGRTYTATSQPNFDDVGDYINQRAAEIDAILAGRGYQVPVPSGAATSAMALLALGNRLGASVDVETAAPNGKPDTAIKLWESFKKTLQDGTLQLPTVEKDTSRSRVRYGGNATAMFRIRDTDS